VFHKSKGTIDYQITTTDNDTFDFFGKIFDFGEGRIHCHESIKSIKLTKIKSWLGNIELFRKGNKQKVDFGCTTCVRPDLLLVDNSSLFWIKDNVYFSGSEELRPLLNRCVDSCQLDIIQNDLIIYNNYTDYDAKHQGDLTKHIVESRNECMQLCNSNADCNSFVFRSDRTTTTNCYLKELTADYNLVEEANSMFYIEDKHYKS